MASQDWIRAIDRAHKYAPFLSLAMNRLPEMTELLKSGEGEAALAWAKQAGNSANDVSVALRRERLALALTLAIGDLAGAFPLLKVTGELSAFADRAMDAAITEAIRRHAPEAEPGGFLALALGKHGAGELNYSSDIDPILLFDPQQLPRRSSEDAGEAAQRIARRVVETLTAMTEEGYVFRVDLRLRPASEVSPLAISIGAALTHYESEALTWERAAFIRARACAGDLAAGEEFLAAIRPFVWRKSLDFGAIQEIGRLTEQIRESSADAPVAGTGFDIKRGRGGIREIEFYAQTHQLIHGGRNPSLRVRGTRASLDALANAGIIAASDAQMLGQSYDRLRTIEHRLQMVSDRQTHQLPEDPDALDAVAKLDGLENGDVLVAELSAITDAVGAAYDKLIGLNTDTEAVTVQASSGDALLAEITRLGFSQPDRLAKRIEGWRSGKLRALRSDAAHAAYATIQTQLLTALAAAPDRDRAIVRWEQMLTNLPSAVNLFRLFEARPGLLQLLVRILSLVPPLADELTRRADLLDPLIDASAFASANDIAALANQMREGEAGEDYQAILDRVRRKVGELRFLLGVQLIEGTSDPLDVSSALSAIAETAISVLADATIAEFRLQHGVIAGSELVILGLGRLGGGALTHASDLDLVYVFTGEFDSESDGPRPLAASAYYNRLCQRITAALSVPTAEGALYQVDTRLRPSGAQGPIAVSFTSFTQYQREEAWTWEHMALCRARVLYGSDKAEALVASFIKELLSAPRDLSKLRTDVLEMRGDISQHKPPSGQLDVKLARGGLVDLEFLVHYQQLRHGTALEPSLGGALAALCGQDMLPGTLGPALSKLSRMLVATRLLSPDSQLPSPAARQVLASACGEANWRALIKVLTKARADVAAAWHATFRETLILDFP
jgi:[glutamine synthetase] adenylyltransferase / [glutamine synthetase]-adenylyl-L-tyrosine phosphorylase